MLVVAFGALLAAIGVGFAIGAPLVAFELERQAVARRAQAAHDVIVADQDLTIEAYREFASKAEFATSVN